MKQKIAILSFLETFEFPLREATRKQIWWKAQSLKSEEVEVCVYIVNGQNYQKYEEGINVRFIPFFQISHIKADYLYCITGSVTLLLPIFFVNKVKREHRILTLTDGDMFGLSKRILRKLVVKFLPYLFGEIQVFSKYQKNRLGLSNSRVVNPYLPNIQGSIIPVNKTKNPSILYMGHISEIKGFDLIIPAITKILEEDNTITFTIANNMIYVEEKYLIAVDKLKQRFPNQIVIKGVVNPIEELKKHWVYIYPFVKAYGTMSFPLSLYESLQCGTPFVACDISANAEFFDKKYLISPNKIELYKKIKHLINEKKNSINI